MRAILEYQEDRIRLAASDNLLQVHDVGVVAGLQHPDLTHGCDWQTCSNSAKLLKLIYYYTAQRLSCMRVSEEGIA